MWILIATAGLCLVAGLAFGVVVASAESRANRMERRARDIVVWSVERVAGASMRAIAAGRVGGRLTPEDLRAHHGWVVDRALKLGREEGLDVAHALGGRNVLEACAWVALTGRVA